MDRLEANMVDALAAAAAGATAGNYLGNTDVVDQLVRDFLASCISVNEQFQTGAISGDAAELQLVDLAKRYASIFLGEVPGYVAQPWNSPRRLEFFLRAKKPPHLEDHARAADAYFCAYGTAGAMLAMRADMKELPEAEVQHELSVIRDEMTRALLGIEWTEHLRASEAT